MNFQIKTLADLNFCIEVDKGVSEGRLITLQQCGLTDSQRWALPLYNDETNAIVESQGMCLDGRFTQATLGFPMTVAKCGSGDRWRFTYTSVSLIQNAKNQKCLGVAGAAANAAVAIVDCDATKKTQQWLITH